MNSGVGEERVKLNESSTIGADKITLTRDRLTGVVCGKAVNTPRREYREPECTYNFRRGVHFVRAAMLVALLIADRNQIGVQSKVENAFDAVHVESHRQHVRMFEILKRRKILILSLRS